MAYLPWSTPGQIVVAPEASAAHVELLSLIALAAANERPPDTPYPAIASQELSHFVSATSSRLSRILELSHLRAAAATDPSNAISVISLMLRSQEVLVRHSSYSEMVEKTVVGLLDGEPGVRAALLEGLGFDAADAIRVLNTFARLQAEGLSGRGQEFADSMESLMAHSENGLTDADRVAGRLALQNLFEPKVEDSMIEIGALASASSLEEDKVRLVISQFRLNIGDSGPEEVAEAFASGRNPMRTHPFVSDGNRILLPHDVLSLGAVREGLEAYLKTSRTWDLCAKHRGEYLEGRVRVALERVLPGATFRDGFEYYLPANEAELAREEPGKYTKRVEGDHLVVLDDVAVIIEDKSVALSSLSREGKSQRLKTDLIGIIAKAADQANRLREVIERDGGVRIEGEGWVDLSSVREVHTIAVSLDDLISITTATAALVEAKILARDNIPWTVSIHDLDLITTLVDRPAEFLLYLQRRRASDVTMLFGASDELDLFLYYFDEGLWIEPDPDEVHATFSWSVPDEESRRRFKEQVPVFLTSRTDALDAWHHGRIHRVEAQVSKPTMTRSPLAEFVDLLQSRGDFGWLSIGATLLSLSTDTQRHLASAVVDLLNQPRPDRRGRSFTVPIAVTDKSRTWLAVWATRPPGVPSSADERRWRNYLLAKKYQLGLARGLVLVIDEATRKLCEVYYDGQLGEVNDEIRASIANLRPPGHIDIQFKKQPKKPPLNEGGKQTRRR